MVGVQEFLAHLSFYVFENLSFCAYAIIELIYIAAVPVPFVTTTCQQTW